VVAYRAFWVTRSGLDVALFLRAWPFSAPTVPRSLARPGSSSRALRSSPEFLGFQSAARLSVYGTFLGVPALFATLTGGVHSREASQASLRSAHDVSHVLDGLLLHRSLRVYFAPQPRPGFTLRGFPLPHSRSSSSLAVALLPLAPASCSRLPGSAGVKRVVFRALLRVPVRCLSWGVSPRTDSIPP
jgi:hypothetical protein